MKIEILKDGPYMRQGFPKNPHQLEKGDRRNFPNEYALMLIDVGSGIEVEDEAVQVDDAEIETPEMPETKEINATSHVKKFAEKAGVNLTLVVGTGNGGKILKSDVENYLKEK